MRADQLRTAETGRGSEAEGGTENAAQEAKRRPLTERRAERVKAGAAGVMGGGKDYSSLKNNKGKK